MKLFSAVLLSIVMRCTNLLVYQVMNRMKMNFKKITYWNLIGKLISTVDSTGEN